MKCYLGGPVDPFDHEFVSVCYANNRAQAKRLMWDETDLAEHCDHNWHKVRVIRHKDGDRFLNELKAAPYIPRDDETLRNLGWMEEGDARCDSCGLAEFDGKWPVCDECGQCVECGCIISEH